MDFELSEDHLLFQRMLRGFVTREVEPHAAEWDETGSFPWDTIRKMTEIGLFGVHFEEKYGGSGDALTFTIATEEISRGSGGLGAIYLASQGLAMYPVTMFGSEAQKQEYIPRVIGGQLAAFGLTETAAGSDVAALTTGYRKTREGYVLNGAKIFITNGAEADFTIVFATRDRSEGYRGISAFIVEKGTPGFSVGKVERKMGIHPSSTAELIFDDCMVPEAGLIDEEGSGFKVAMSAIDASRVCVAAQALGIARAAYEASVSYVKERRQFGTELAHMQGIQWMIADMATELDAARLLTYRAAWLTDKEGHAPLKEAAMAKLFASEAANRVCHTALQIHGGYGYTRDFPLERYSRDQRITEIYEGTSEMQRWTIARQILEVR